METSDLIQELLTPESKCPICDIHNLVWSDAEKLADHFGQELESVVPRGHVFNIGPYRVAIGSACWDAPFGDECGGCLNSILNTETALIGPNGMCHD